MASTRGGYYEVLGVARTATAEEIHRAYRRLARRYHPDVNSAADARVRFAELSTAYEVLHDPARRARYDRSSAADRRAGATPRTASPAFSSGHPRRDVPRFLDEDMVSTGPTSAPPPRPVRVVVWDAPQRPQPATGLLWPEGFPLPWWW